MKNIKSIWCFSMPSGWLAAALPINETPGLKIHHNKNWMFLVSQALGVINCCGHMCLPNCRRQVLTYNKSIVVVTLKTLCQNKHCIEMHARKHRDCKFSGPNESTCYQDHRFG